MIDSSLALPREIVSMEPDNGGSRITLACGHVVWSPIDPIYDGKMYCAICVHQMLDQIKSGQRQK